MEITFTSRISFGDFYKYNLVILVRNAGMIFYLCLVAFFWLNVLGTSGRALENPHIIFLVMNLLLFLMPALVYIGARRFYNSNSYLQEPQTFIINENTVSMHSASVSNTIRWRGMNKFIETGNYLIIHAGTVPVMLMPKKDIQDSRDIEQIRLWAGRKKAG